MLEGDSSKLKNKGTPFELCPKLWTWEKISPRHVDRRKCCQLSSTDEGRLFITLCVHFCVRHDRRDATRCAGSSAIAEACINRLPVIFTTAN